MISVGSGTGERVCVCTGREGATAGRVVGADVAAGIPDCDGVSTHAAARSAKQARRARNTRVICIKIPLLHSYINA